jgi:hypothetical protein
MKKNNILCFVYPLAFLAVFGAFYYFYLAKVREGQQDMKTGEYIPMSSSNGHSVSSVLADLERDFDSTNTEEIPRLSRRINALDERISALERNQNDASK